MCCNDNEFGLKRMLVYNTVFYDNDTDDWYQDEVNQKVATCYIKFSKNHVEYIQPIHPDNGDNIVTKDNEIIIPRAKFIPIAPVIVIKLRHIIPLYTYVMKNKSNTVSIYPSTNKSIEDDEFQIKIDSKINLPLLQIANAFIQNHIDFLNFVTKNKGHGEKFTTYEKSKFRKYKKIVNSLFKELKVNDLMKLMLLIDEIEASEIVF